MARSSKREGSDPPMTPEDLGALVVDDHAEALRHESEKIAAKINEAYGKLASKLRGKADRARSALETKKSEKKRVLLRRRFELYADAANELEMRAAERLGAEDSDSD